MFTTRCPRCQTEVNYDSHYPGVRIRCETCKHVFTGPAQATEKRIAANTDHLPFCTNCGKFVEAQVVGSTQVTGGRTLVAPSGLGLTQVSSHTVYRKFCRICGTPVYSQMDLDAINRRTAEGDRKMRVTLIACGSGIALTALFIWLYSNHYLARWMP